MNLRFFNISYLFKHYRFVAVTVVAIVAAIA